MCELALQQAIVRASHSESIPSFMRLSQVKLHPFFQANSRIGNRIDWKELMTSKAVFVPNSASREAPSEYFEEKPVRLSFHT